MFLMKEKKECIVSLNREEKLSGVRKGEKRLGI